jgi:hypothetical protein
MPTIGDVTGGYDCAEAERQRVKTREPRAACRIVLLLMLHDSIEELMFWIADA